MSHKQLLLWNSIVWAVVMLGCAVVLKGSDEFIGVLLVLICGMVGSDAVVNRYWSEGPKARR